ncbi:hypothetical protein [Saccharopolyspora shandongensis]|uniref:hypothetical protein n=1 Tax=Saccharopolyspora shandongensis TaxID=418495 RepID=UPI003401044F
MSDDTLREEIIAASPPGESILDLMPRHWTHVPSDDGGWLLLGGELAGDPEVLVRTEHAFPAGGGCGDLTEPLNFLLGRLLARELGGRVVQTDLSEEDVTALHSQLRWLRVLMRSGR